jgi:branched-chain amino acid transport system permease protein
VSFSLDLLLQFIASGVVQGSAYVLVAVGLTLVFGVLGTANFAHGEFYMLGGFGGALAASWLGLPLIGAAAASFVGLAIVGGLLDLAVFRPAMVRSGPAGVVVASFGLAVALQNTALLAFGPQPVLLRSSLGAIPVVMGPVVLTAQRVLVPVVALVMMTALGLMLRYSWAGRALRAAAQNGVAAQVCGVDPRRVALLTFAIAAAFAGAAGALMASVYTVDPQTGAAVTLKAFVVVILGGMGSVAGAAVAGLGLGIAEALVSAYLGNGLRDIFGFALVILVLLVRPQGLFGRVADRS